MRAVYDEGMRYICGMEEVYMRRCDETRTNRGRDRQNDFWGGVEFGALGVHIFMARLEHLHCIVHRLYIDD